MPLTYYERTTDCLKALGEQGVYRVAVEVMEGSHSLMELECPKPTALVFGNEVTGINDRVMRHCDAAVQIPMMGFKNSMNVATAFGIVLFELLRKWDAFHINQDAPGHE